MLATLATIWLLHVAALMVPGPNVMLVSQMSASGSPRGAAIAAVGVAAGAVLWSSAAVLGVGALFAAFPAVRLALQAVGAFYLLYVGARLWRSNGAARAAGPPSDARAFRLGLMTNMSNPKSALFFGSVFSASLPAHPPAWVLAAAVAVVVVNALCWHLLLAHLFSRPLVRRGYEAQCGRVARIAGTVVGGFGASLLLASIREARRTG